MYANGRYHYWRGEIFSNDPTFQQGHGEKVCVLCLQVRHTSNTGKFMGELPIWKSSVVGFHSLTPIKLWESLACGQLYPAHAHAHVGG